MNILDKMKKGLLYFDGAQGSVLQEMGLKPGELPEVWNLTNPSKIIDMHKGYLDAGSNIILTNTFGANSFKFTGENNNYSLEEIINAAVKNVRKAFELTSNKNVEHYIALDIGPTGKLLKPMGELDFEEAVNVFKEIVDLGVKNNVDLIVIETMNDSYETKAAVLAAKENSNLPVFVTNVYDENKTLMTGADPIAMISLLEGLRVDAIGMNCSLGPAQMVDIVKIFKEYSSLPIIVNPNAGLPRSENGRTVYDVDAEEFSDIMVEIVKNGARIIGGCCGTTPEYIKKLVEKTKDLKPVEIVKKNNSFISSYTHGVEFGKKPVLIGERINPTGKKKFKEALRNHDINYILNEAVKQEELGVKALDVNVGLPEIDEVEMMVDSIRELQAITDLPLQIDTSNYQALEKAMRIYNGKPMVNSVNGKKESMDAIFPLIAKYGGLVVALTLDENGIPDNVEGRIKIVENIYSYAEKFGIDKKDIIIDTLAMTISADTSSALVTLGTLERVKKEFNGITSLGVSNISFGLPNRDLINGTFFAMALEKGLDAAIMNPNSIEMMKTYYAFNALSNYDPQCKDYIDFASNLEIDSKVINKNEKSKKVQAKVGLQDAIIKGLKEEANIISKRLLEEKKPLEIINEEIVPALDIVGIGFENKTLYLPQLLMSAEAAKEAFENIKVYLEKAGQREEKKYSIVLATVKGDIHDIGKNIVKVLLENYGFNIIDLGRDVSPEIIVETVVKKKVKLVGLGALMTTTVPAMEETIELLRKEAPYCKVMVGGAVLTPEYAKMINADFYGKDAMESVRYAESLI
ncbi:MAG TPA: dihydropteroate synthase [Gallicola sp.]|nr:dihydropteroate synthase [Gallicola sp.]